MKNNHIRNGGMMVMVHLSQGYVQGVKLVLAHTHTHTRTQGMEVNHVPQGAVALGYEYREKNDVYLFFSSAQDISVRHNKKWF